MRYRPVGPRKLTHSPDEDPLDGTQTSEPTETGPGSPGQASAFRRALDDQAQTEGPLDLTVPLNIAEIRAALSNSGSIPIVPASADAPPRGVAPSPPQRPHNGRRSRHAHSRRLGRIAVFVTLAAALSVGTATALVLSSSSQGSSVSLPPTSGNIPGLPTGNSTGIGQAAGTTGSTTAKAAASPSHSVATTTAAATSAAPSATAGASDSASGDPSSTAGSASADPSSTGAGPSSSGSTWVTLYWGIQNEDQEVSQVQSMLDQLGYLWHHHSAYVNPMYNGVQPDSTGSYGSATEDAVASFQQDYGVAYGGQAGTCDYTTYEALVQAVNAQSGQSAQTAQAGQST